MKGEKKGIFQQLKRNIINGQNGREEKLLKPKYTSYFSIIYFPSQNFLFLILV